MWTFLAAEEPASLIVPDSVQKANLAEAVNKIVNMDFSTLFGSLIRESLWILVKVLIALAIYFIGRWLVRRFLRLIDVAMQHRNVDISLRSFTRNTVSAFFTLLLILIVVSTLGVNVTSLIAVASAATLAIGMALSGTAQNFAGGVMILLMKPYRIGDYIEAQGQAGTVKEIRLFSTVVTTTDNKRIYIPNSSISNAIVNNYSSETMRRSIERLRRLDFVVIDTPPMGMFPDAELLCDMADQSMLVVRQDTIPAADINDCVDALNNSSAHFLGCVLNDMRGSSGYGYGYGYGYGRGYGHGKKYGYYGNYKKEAGSADGRMNG